MKKLVRPGEVIPPFYGIAYIQWETDEAVAYPLFLNLLVILWRDCLHWLKHPKGRSL